MHNKLKL